MLTELAIESEIKKTIDRAEMLMVLGKKPKFTTAQLCNKIKNLLLLHPDGLLREQLVAMIPATAGSIMGRINDLVRIGHLIESGKKHTQSGSWAKIIRLSTTPYLGCQEYTFLRNKKPVKFTFTHQHLQRFIDSMNVRPIAVPIRDYAVQLMNDILSR